MQNSADRDADSISLCSISSGFNDVQISRRIVSKHSGRELELDDSRIIELSQNFTNIPDKYAVFEKMFLQLFLVGISILYDR